MKLIPRLYTNRQGKTNERPQDLWIVLLLSLPLIAATVFAAILQGW